MGSTTDDRSQAGAGQAETGTVVTVGAPVVGSAVETVTGVLEDAGARAGAAWAALRSPTPQLVATRRWPWAIGAAVAGAAAGAAVALAVGRVRTSDQPDALEPDEVRAVVDRGEDAPPPP